MGYSKYDEDNWRLSDERWAMKETDTNRIDVVASLKENYKPIRIEISVSSRPHKVYKRRELICKDCRKIFIYSIKQQKRFDGLGFRDPIRCRSCIDAKKRYFADYDRKGE